MSMSETAEVPVSSVWFRGRSALRSSFYPLYVVLVLERRVYCRRTWPLCSGSLMRLSAETNVRLGP